MTNQPRQTFLFWGLCALSVSLVVRGDWARHGRRWQRVAGLSPLFYLIFFVDRFGGGWHKQIKAGSKYHANNQ